MLVEADLRLPTAARKLGIPAGTPGLSDLLISDGHVEDFLVPVYEDLLVLPSGTIPPNPSDLLSSSHVADVLEMARSAADVVLIDAPPLLTVADTRVLLQMPQIDGVIVVGQVRRSRGDHARAAQDVLRQSGRRVLGLVVTGAPETFGSSYYDVPSDTTSKGFFGRRRITAAR